MVRLPVDRHSSSPEYSNFISWLVHTSDSAFFPPLAIVFGLYSKCSGRGPIFIFLFPWLWQSLNSAVLRCAILITSFSPTVVITCQHVNVAVALRVYMVLMQSPVCLSGSGSGTWGQRSAWSRTSWTLVWSMESTALCLPLWRSASGRGQISCWPLEQLFWPSALCLLQACYYQIQHEKIT